MLLKCYLLHRDIVLLTSAIFCIFAFIFSSRSTYALYMWYMFFALSFSFSLRIKICYWLVFWTCFSKVQPQSVAYFSINFFPVSALLLVNVLNIKERVYQSGYNFQKPPLPWKIAGYAPDMEILSKLWIIILSLFIILNQLKIFLL